MDEQVQDADGRVEREANFSEQAQSVLLPELEQDQVR